MEWSIPEDPVPGLPSAGATGHPEPLPTSTTNIDSLLVKQFRGKEPHDMQTFTDNAPKSSDHQIPDGVDISPQRPFQDAPQEGKQGIRSPQHSQASMVPLEPKVCGGVSPDKMQLAFPRADDKRKKKIKIDDDNDYLYMKQISSKRIIQHKPAVEASSHNHRHAAEIGQKLEGKVA